MGVLEIVLPSLKRDAALVSEFREKLAPVLFTRLQEAGVPKGLYGTLVTENDRDVRDELRTILLLEWPAAQNFKDFIVSPGFREVAARLKERYAEARPQPKLFEDVDDVSPIFAAAGAVVEYLLVRPRDASDAGVKNVQHQLQVWLLQLGVAIGSSSNLETQEIAVVGVYASDAELEAAKKSATRQQVLTEIAEVADVTSLVAHVQKVIPLAK